MFEKLIVIFFEDAEKRKMLYGASIIQNMTEHDVIKAAFEQTEAYGNDGAGMNSNEVADQVYVLIAVALRNHLNKIAA